MHTLNQISDALYIRGFLNKEDHNSIRDLVVARNLLAHATGFEVDKKDLENAREMARALIKNLDNQ